MIKIVVIILLIINFIWENFLVLLNLNFIKQKLKALPGVLPKSLREKISIPDYIRSAEYSNEKAVFGIISSSFNLFFIFFVIWFSLLNYVNDWTKELFFGRVFFCITLLLITSFLTLPFKAYLTFVIEKKFGFNKTDVRTFCLDFLKIMVMSVLILFPLLGVLFWIFDSFPNYWWVLGFVLFSIFKLMMLIVYPILIAPVFNKFTPLPEGELLDEIKILCKRADFPLEGVFIMDGSKRSTHSNAYFTGIGKSKRIVLFDTLVKKLTTSELVSVLAHELGHFKLHHVKINLLISMIFSFLIFFLLNLVLKSEYFFTELGYSNPEIHIGIVLLGIVLPTVDMFITPVFNILSRKHEYAADRFSIEKYNDGKNSLSGALIKLNIDNLSNPIPHPLYSFIHYSHPPLIERLKSLEAV